MVRPQYEQLSRVKHLIRDGDLLLYRRRGLISAFGRGIHSHAAKAAWWDGELFCLEVRAVVGGRAVTLESQVNRYPGRIDVYEANAGGRWPEFNRRGCVRAMRKLAGARYGYRGLLRVALLHLPVLRLFVKPATDDQSLIRTAPFCSHACALADRLGGGVDPVNELADWLTEPADLARSPFYKYRFTLIPD